ncbi:MAG: ATP-binding protein [Chitinivibrionia bacterium]|nr:ATP-binding protein [Chitinivibrionia bacterium]
MKNIIFIAVTLLCIVSVTITAILIRYIAQSEPTRIIPFTVLIVVGISITALFAANIIVKKIVEPINKIDLENPENCDIYEELSPLLKRISEQNLIVARQMEKIKKRKTQFEIIGENMQEGLLILDKDDRILYYNKSATRILDEKNDNLLKKNIFVLCRNEYFRRGIKQAKESDEQIIYSFEINNKTIEMIARSVATSKGRIGTTVLIMDVSEKTNREKLRREFSANVSHELKTPLSVISGYAEIISNGLAKKEDISDFGTKIYSEAQYLLELINDIIELSNLDESRGFTFEKVNIYEFAKGVISRIEEKANEKNINIKLSGSDIIISAIPRLLDEIFSNLLENAIKYNKENGSVSINIEEKENFVILSVEDTGIGIPKSKQSRVFERFFRVDTSRTGRQGTGLGLSIVKHAVQIHKGKVSVSSVENSWTKFVVELPLELKGETKITA